MGRSGFQYTVPWAHRSPKRKRYLNGFSRFCRAHWCDRRSDHATRSVTIGRISYVVGLLRCGLKICGLQIEWWGAYVSSTVQMICVCSRWCHYHVPPNHLLLHQNPDWLNFLVPVYPGCPGKEAVKRASHFYQPPGHATPLPPPRTKCTSNSYHPHHGLVYDLHIALYNGRSLLLNAGEYAH